MKPFRLPALVVALVFTVGAAAASAWVHGTTAPAPAGSGPAASHSQISVATGKSFGLSVTCSAGQDPARGGASGTGARPFTTASPPPVTSHWSVSTTDVSTSERSVRAVAICSTP
ncbi:hypothetical protein M1P56_19070 [Streptomyces sp. HU2014]|uniref:hypothetical protein n=1 Tax=Streptomyces sp. HU2014 TaxID=2939414 RepID=UPI00200CE191|nr:hypothetical protein [Streptomyces sp. HU2014]UQI46294.1 hypothetical protein M1P56_19070 [Streptomyces sp. HU2014]